MKLFVAWYICDYDGIDILGIFDNKTKADAVVSNYRLIHHIISSFDSCGVSEYVLNEVIE